MTTFGTKVVSFWVRFRSIDHSAFSIFLTVNGRPFFLAGSSSWYKVVYSSKQKSLESQ